MAGDESAIWHTIFSDFLLVAQKLEELGFIYSEREVLVVDTS
jgi:hypothetical protein